MQRALAQDSGHFLALGHIFSVPKQRQGSFSRALQAKVGDLRGVGKKFNLNIAV